MKFFRSRLFAFVLAIAVLCVGLMIFSAYSGQPSILSKLLGAAGTPVQQAVSDTIDGVRDFFGYFYRYAALEEENARLKEELEEYRRKALELAQRQKDEFSGLDTLTRRDNLSQ